MFEEEINEFVQGELSYLDLSTYEKEMTIKGINKRINNMLRKNRSIDIEQVIEYFNKDIEKRIEYFKSINYTEEEAIILTKNIINCLSNSKINNILNFYKVCNILEDELRISHHNIRVNLEHAHAKKKFLVDNNDKIHQSRSYILHNKNTDFENHYNVCINDLVNKYPLNEEIYSIWNFICHKTDPEIIEFFGMTREELSYIYPTTKEEVATLKLLANMTDEEVIKKYGICKQNIYNRRPINNDLLKALKSINLSSEKAIEKYFNENKATVLLDPELSMNKIKQKIRK